MFNKMKALHASRGPWILAALAAVIALIPAQIIRAVLATAGLIDWPTRSLVSFASTSSISVTLDLILLTPLIETLLMTIVIGACARFRSTDHTAVIICTILFAALHGISEPLRPLIVIGPFFIFSVLYITCRPRSTEHAVAVVATSHILYNITSAAIDHLLVTA